MPAPASVRRGYLDWLRGIAVLIMIAAHILDSWTRAADRNLPEYRWSIILGGFGAPLFLFLAGVAVVLSAASKLRRSGDPDAAAHAVAKRGLEIFGLAFLFRLQAVIVSWGSWHSMLKVDILNIMGPAIMGSAALWRFGRDDRGRVFVLLATTLAIAFLTPPVRSFQWLHVLPDPIEGYLRPVPGITNFAFFPWAAFVTAGALVGIFINEARTEPVERRLNVWLAIIGLTLAAAGYAVSYLPSPYAHSDFWTSSPAFFLLRTGILVASVALAYAWQQAPGRTRRFSPLQQMGRTSLFIYWIHVEMIYGLISLPLHKSLTLGQAWLGVLVFSILMLILSLLKDRFVAAWRATHERAQGSLIARLR